MPETEPDAPFMRTERRGVCPLCGGPGVARYRGISDRLFGVSGRWDIRACGRTACGVLWLDPAPVADDLHIAYRVYSTHEGVRDQGALPSRLQSLYGEAQQAHVSARFGYPFNRHPLVRGLLLLALRSWPGRAAYAESEVLHLPVEPGGRVLDVGCGNGRAVGRLRSLGWDAEGIDVDAAAVATARRRGLPVRVGDLHSSDFTPGAFAAVTLSHVVEHVHDPASMIADCARLLRPGGRLVVVTPNMNSFLSSRYGHDWRGLEPPRHLLVFNRTALVRLVREAGLEEERSFTSVRGANCAAVSARAFRRDGRQDPFARIKMRDRAWAELVQQAEALRLRFDPDAGEEIVVVARRSWNGGSSPERLVRPTQTWQGSHGNPSSPAAR